MIPLARDSLEGEMAERRIGQLSFADNLVAEVMAATTTLDRIASLVDWTPIAALLSEMRGGTMGAPVAWTVRSGAGGCPQGSAVVSAFSRSFVE
jgi:hypothetical protein